MGGRRLSERDGQHLAIRTDVKGKGVAVHDARRDGRHDGGRSGEYNDGRNDGPHPGESGPCSHLRRTTSLNSMADSVDEQAQTHLSASSAGNDTLSSSGMSGHSTARTSAMLSDDDRSAPSVPTSPSPHAHPAVTVLELVSNIASSSALPDTFSFHLSRKGTFVAVFTTSTIWLIKTAELPRLWARTLQVKRKPVAVDIVEDGSLLAVLSRPSQVDLYEIHGEHNRQIKKRRTIMLVHEAHSMRISPDGCILITGNGFGIEVVSIGPGAPETSRRTLSGPTGDTLEFSDDGRTLLITGYARKAGSSSMFVLPGLYDGPLDEEGVPVPSSPEAGWTGLVLFPESTKIARQATLLPDTASGTVNELFAFNADEDTWGIYDIGAQRFTQQKMFLPDQQRWTRAEFLDDAMPAVSANADLAAVALKMRGTTSLWIYQVPDWDYKPKSQASPIQPCFCVPILRDSEDANQEICELRWVSIGSRVQRLVAVGNVSKVGDNEDCPVISQASKGVMIILDFDKSRPAGSPAPSPIKVEYDLDPLLPGERLPEGQIDFESEVELVRTRTMAQRRAQTRAGDGRRNSGQLPGPGRARTTAANRDRAPPVPSIRRDDDEELTMEEAQAAFEAPYDNTQPRSHNSLARAATVAAVSPANRRHLRSLPFRPLEYRRADGMREFPHESDADNWVPPPPAYTASAEESHSVSLSHPNRSPNTQPPSNNSNNSNNNNHPYHHRPSIASQSSHDLTIPSSQSRPALLHPSTFPSPQSASPGRRRSSASQHPPQPQPQTDPQPPVPTLPLDQRRAPPPSAYQATSTRHAALAAVRRPSLRARGGVESQVDLRPPPVINPAAANGSRRGSAPDTGIIARRPVGAPPAARNPNRMSMPLSATHSSAQRSMLPRLTTPGSSASAQRSDPLSAPPRGSHSRFSRFTGTTQQRPASSLGHGHGLQEHEVNGRKEKKKKVGCIVM